MTFNKEEYWKNRNNTIKKKDENGKTIRVPAPKRGQGTIPKGKIINTSEVKIGFNNDGEIVVMNRAYRRRKLKLPKEKKVLSQKSKKKMRKRRKK